MECTQTSSNLKKYSNMKLATEDTSNSGILGKLRRLKIEEGLISKSMGKSAKTSLNGSEIAQTNDDNNERENNIFVKIRNSYIEIRNLFEDIKANTSSQDNLKVVELDDVKKDVFELEMKIKNFKIFLQSELLSLKIEEQELSEQQYNNFTEVNRIKRKPSLSVTPFNDIVPSPVGVLLNSPFKSPEVQELQEFMRNSKNRYGGWVPYNHNVFIKYWQKYFWTKRESNNSESQEPDIRNSVNFQLFIQDLIQHIPGMMTKDIIVHIEWYSKYLSLKERQEIALKKWRTNKKIIKKTHETQALQNNKQTKSKAVQKPCTCRLIEAVDNNAFSTLVSDGSKAMESRTSNEIYSDVTKVTHDDGEKIFVPEVEFGISFQETVNKKRKSKLKEKIYLQKAQNTIRCQNYLRFANPTKQWENRSKMETTTIPRFTSVESLSRLRIPDWRLGLQEGSKDMVVDL